MPNGGTLTESGAKENFTAFCYYNNGNSQSAELMINSESTFFSAWSSCRHPTKAYPSKTASGAAAMALYAMWVTTEYDFPYTGNYVQFVIPQDGIYEFEIRHQPDGHLLFKHRIERDRFL